MGTSHKLMGLSSLNSDNLPVYVNGYTTFASFKENTSIRSQLCFISIDTIILDKVLIFYLWSDK